MTVAMTGKPVADALKKELRQKVDRLRKKGIAPLLQMIRVGDRKDDLSYERSLRKNCSQIGIKYQITRLSENVQQAELEKKLKEANADPEIHGILVFRPLPASLDTEAIRQLIDPKKDVDCMSPVNMGMIFNKGAKQFSPCTAKSVMTLLDYYQIPLQGAKVVLVGASTVVGRPLTLLLLDRFATTTICQLYTENIPEITQKAEVVVTACGVAKLLKENYFNSDAVVVDVGMNTDDRGNLCGDVDYERVYGKVGAITPTIGGVGVITTTILLEHVVAGCEKSL